MTIYSTFCMDQKISNAKRPMLDFNKKNSPGIFQQNRNVNARIMLQILLI